MPDVRFGIDASGAQRGYAELSRIFAGITQGAQEAANAIKAVQSAGTGGNASSSRAAAEAAKVAARATQEQATAQKLVAETSLLSAKAATEVAKANLYQAKTAAEAAKAELTKAKIEQQAASAKSRSAKEQITATDQLQRAQAKQLQFALTALSTLGDENRAYAQLTQWHVRRAKAMGEEVNYSRLLTDARVRLAAADTRAAAVFSTSAVAARDLRTNMASLATSFTRLTSMLGLVNPQLGILVSNALLAKQALGGLQGGFATLAIPIGVLAAAGVALGVIAKVGGEAAEGLRLTEEALKSSGAASGITIRQVDAVATSMARTTKITDDQVIQLTRSLVGLRGVTAETFESIIRLAADAAARGFGSFEQNAKVIARAIAGTKDFERAFKSLGVVLSATEREQVKLLAETGDSAERTRLIFELLQKTIGGGAAAEANTVSGSIKILTGVLEDYIEEADKAAGVSSRLRDFFQSLAAAAAAVGPEMVFKFETSDIDTKIRESQRKQEELKQQIREQQGRLIPNVAGLQSGLEAEINREMKLRQAQMELEQQDVVDQATRENAKRLQAKQTADEREAAFQRFIRGNDEAAAAAAKFREGQAIVLAQLREGNISFDEAVKRIREVEAATVGEARNRRESATAAKDQAEAIREAAEAQKAYADALAQFRVEEEEAGRGTSKRIEDLKFENEALERYIVALGQGAEAVRALEIEEAGLQAVREARGRDPAISFDEEAAVRQAAQRNTALKQQIVDQTTAAKAVSKTWDIAITGIQQGFADIWTNLITDGKSAFDGIGDLFKNLVARMAAEIANAEVFEPLFDALRSGMQSAGQAGGGGGGGGSSFSNPLNMLTGAIKNLTGMLGGGGGTTFAKLGGGLPSGFGIGPAQAGGGLSLGGTGAAGSFAGIGGSIASFGPAAGFAAAALLTPMAIKNWIDLFKGDLNKNEKMATIIGTSIGTMLLGPWGAVLGGAIGKLFVGTPSQKIAVATAASAAGLPPLEGGLGITRTTPFGVIGAAGSDTSTNMRAAISGTLGAIAQIDETLAAAMTRAERDMIKQAGLPLIGANAKNTIEKLTVQRITDVLRAIGLPESTIGGVSGDIGKATELLGARREILDFLAKVNGTFVELTQSEEAIAQIQKMVDAIRLAAPALGIMIDNIEELETQAIARVREGFQKAIGESILALTDPATLAANQLAKAQEARLKEAQALGADLVEVERLSGLERIELLKQINAPLQDIIDTLTFSVSGQSPTAALEAAQARFGELTQPGALGRREDIAAAAQTLLSLGEQFLGGPGFATQREEILGTLTDLISEWPVIGSEMNDQMINLSLETARGNAANEQLLNQLVIEVSALRADNLRLQASLEQILAA